MYKMKSKSKSKWSGHLHPINLIIYILLLGYFISKSVEIIRDKEEKSKKKKAIRIAKVAGKTVGWSFLSIIAMIIVLITAFLIVIYILDEANIVPLEFWAGVGLELGVEMDRR